MSKLLSVLAIAFATIFSFNAMAEQHSGHGVHGSHASKAHGEKAKAHAEKDEAHAKDAKVHAEKDSFHAKEAKAHAEKDEAHAQRLTDAAIYRRQKKNHYPNRLDLFSTESWQRARFNRSGFLD